MSQYSESKHSKDGAMQAGPGNHQGGHGQGPHGQGMRNRGPGGQGGWVGQRGQMRGGRGGGGGGGRGGRGGNFRNQQPGGTGAKAKNTLKFDNDYDFEQANTEFEELR